MLCHSSSDPFSGYFARLANNQFYSILDVSIQASMWCAAIGGPDSNPPPIDNGHCLPSMKTAKPEWRDHTIEGDESWDISLAGLFGVTQSNALRYADIVITVDSQINCGDGHFTVVAVNSEFFTRRLDGTRWRRMAPETVRRRSGADTCLGRSYTSAFLAADRPNPPPTRIALPRRLSGLEFGVVSAYSSLMDENVPTVPTEWLEALAESDADLAAGRIVRGEVVLRDLKDSLARLEAKAAVDPTCKDTRRR